MADSPPELVCGRYRVLGHLGKGAMGLVLMAYDPVLDRKVAIKQMTAEIADDEELRKRFYVEARAAARLNHPNIITIHELHESEGAIFIVMELLEGQSLATLVQANPVPLSLEATLDVMAQVCDGLDYAHQRAIVHRDIKPANLFLTPSGTVKILDFGIARLGSLHLTATGTLIGTPDYMSPEQIRGDEIDRRTDLWAAGAVLYQLLSGTKPFEGRPLARLLAAISQTPHAPLQQRAPSVPKSVSDLVDRLLSKPRDGRPASAALVRDELRAILGRETASATRATLAENHHEDTLLMGAEVPPPPPAAAPPASTAAPAASTAPPSAPAAAPEEQKRSGLLITLSVVLVVGMLSLVGMGGAAWWYFGQQGSSASNWLQRLTGRTASGPAPSTSTPPSAAAPATAPPTSPAADAAPAAPAPPVAAPVETASAARGPATPGSGAGGAAREPAAAAPAERPSVKVPGTPPVETGVAPAPAARPGLTQGTVDSVSGRQQGLPSDGSVSTLAAVNRVNYVLEQYVQALVHADAEGIREYRTALSPEEAALMRARQLKVRLEDVRVDVTGADATARCRRRVEGVSSTGAPLQEDAAVVFRLVRRQAGWVITDVR